jgi:hypothetical protein
MFQPRLLLFVLFPLLGLAATLPPAALQEWHLYTNAARGEVSSRALVGKPFLRSDEYAEMRGQIRSGQVATREMNASLKKHLPSSLIHHWAGGIFIPNATIAEVVQVLRDYPRYKDMYRPTVQESSRMERAPLSMGNNPDAYRSIMAYKSALIKTAFQTEYEVLYLRPNSQSGYSLMRTTRVQEIDKFGSPGQRFLPEGQGSGIIWSLFGLTRFVERDGGVVLEVEAIGLSRGIPMGLRWIVQPIVRRVLRESLAISLRQTKESVETQTRLRLAEKQPNPKAPGSPVPARSVPSQLQISSQPH